MPTLNVSFTRTYTENESMYTVCKKWQKMDTRFYFNVKDRNSRLEIFLKISVFKVKLPPSK